MYLPAHFAQAEPEQMHQLIRQHPLGVLVHSSGGALDADHLPFEFDPHTGPLGTLTAHVARANPLWQRIASGTEVLVIFRGEHAYVSPSWYPSKAQTHRQVPTWNYEVVHAHGILTVQDDERFVRGVVGRLTRRHEAGEPQPWKMSDSPPEFITGMLAKVVGLEITLTALTGKSKLSQNKDEPDRLGAAQALDERGQTALAQRMRQVG